MDTRKDWKNGYTARLEEWIHEKIGRVDTLQYYMFVDTLQYYMLMDTLQDNMFLNTLQYNVFLDTLQDND